MFYYTYQIFDLTSKKFYIGKRNSKVHPSKDLGVKYFSSSKDKEFINSQKVNPKNFEYRILGVFNNSEDACKHEIELHETYNVGINKRFYNRAKQTSTGFDTTGVRFSHRIVQRFSKDRELLDEKLVYEYEEDCYDGSCISQCCNGVHKSHKSFIFKYKDDENFKWPEEFIIDDNFREKLSNNSKKMWENEEYRNKILLAKKDRFAITDGEIYKLVKKESQIPEGWYKGLPEHVLNEMKKRFPKGEEHYHYNHLWITNGEECKRIHKDERKPDGWEYGRIATWENPKFWKGKERPEHSEFIINYWKNLPEEIKKERIEKISGENSVWFGKEHTQESKDKISKANKGRCTGLLWITNRIDNKRIKETDIIPEGWYKGRSKFNYKDENNKAGQKTKMNKQNL